jgi:RHS repeat-associated protein
VTGVGSPGSGNEIGTNVHGDVAMWFRGAPGTQGLTGYAYYDPYGTETPVNRVGLKGFQGDYTDPSTGLVDMGARWYAPSTGSFVSGDTLGGTPLSSAVDGNNYAYTNGNPLTDTDPTGHYDPGSVTGTDLTNPHVRSTRAPSVSCAPRASASRRRSRSVRVGSGA